LTQTGRLEKRTSACANSDIGRYSPLVKRKEADRIIGAATTTTGSIVTQETIHDNSQ